MTELLNIFPGISCAYIDKTGRVEYECYGTADKESNINTDVSTIFPACSISKWITAICVMKLNIHDRFFSGRTDGLSAFEQINYAHAVLRK